jgi:hypothetical protein
VKVTPGTSGKEENTRIAREFNSHEIMSAKEGIRGMIAENNFNIAIIALQRCNECNNSDQEFPKHLLKNSVIIIIVLLKTFMECNQ